MKISFDDKSYIEVKMSNDKILISISGKDYKTPNTFIANSAEISIEDLKKLLLSIGIQINS